jgi:hypothetical protein
MAATFSRILLIFDLTSSPDWVLRVVAGNPAEAVDCWRLLAGNLARSQSSTEGGCLRRMGVGSAVGEVGFAVGLAVGASVAHIV